jgi:ComF family protein
MISERQSGDGRMERMQRLIDLLVPPECPGCGREGEAPCRPCLAAIGRRLSEPTGLPIGLAGSQPRGIVQLEWCGPYSGVARDCLHALKYEGEQRLAIALGRLMADRWQRAGIGGQVLVPVPVHAERRRERGFDQAELLARVIGRQLGLPVVTAVSRAQRTAAQHSLGRGARAANVGRVFAVPERQAPLVRARWAVLVDDVMTTGATLAACAEALGSAGVQAVSALVLARER